MNKDRRIKLCDLSEQIEFIKCELEEIKDEEQGSRDNLPENLQNSGRAERMDEIIYSMEESIDSLESAVNSIQEAIN